jgi:hypothetical protein
MKAKYYIYRNLNKGGFSVKHRGKVIAVSDTIEAHQVEFRVSQAGRKRALEQRRRNVHAYAVCSELPLVDTKPSNLASSTEMIPVWYNPFKATQFRAGNIDIFNTITAYFADGKCFVKEGSFT